MPKAELHCQVFKKNNVNMACYSHIVEDHVLIFFLIDVEE